jgi:hypothetical protein
MTNITWQKNQQEMPNEWMPPGLAHIACGDTLYAAKYSTIVRASDGSVEEGSGHIEVRTYDGDLLFSFDETPVTRFKGRVAAVRGSRVFMANNNSEEFPVMMEYVLETHAK